MDCIHGLDPRWCSVCLNGIAHDQASGTDPNRAIKPVKVSVSKPKAKVDPFMSKVERILGGSWCGDCDTPTYRGLCACKRAERFELHKDVLSEWARQVPGDTPRARKATGFLAYGALSREATRAGLTPARREIEMRASRDANKIATNWAPFKVSTADALPIPS